MGFFAERRARNQAALQAANIRLLTSPDTPVSLLTTAVREYPEDRPYVAANPHAPIHLLEQLAAMNDPTIAKALAGNPAWNQRTGS